MRLLHIDKLPNQTRARIYLCYACKLNLRFEVLNTEHCADEEEFFLFGKKFFRVTSGE